MDNCQENVFPLIFRLACYVNGWLVHITKVFIYLCLRSLSHILIFLCIVSRATKSKQIICFKVIHT